MKWTLASIKPPAGNADEYSWRRVKDKNKFNPMLNINGNMLEYGWLRSEFSFDEVEYLDESPDPPTTEALEREAERLYPVPSGVAGLDGDYTLSDIRVLQQKAFIACASKYIAKINDLEFENKELRDNLGTSRLAVEILEAEIKRLKALLDTAWCDGYSINNTISLGHRDYCLKQFKKAHDL